MNPVFLQLHVNLMQELLMPEGERIFHTLEGKCGGLCTENRGSTCAQGGRLWYDEKTIRYAMSQGIKTVDISGRWN